MDDPAQWWFERNGQQNGPVPFAKLQELASSGELLPGSLVWTTGMPGWARADTVPSLSWPAPPPPIAPPPPAPPPLAAASGPSGPGGPGGPGYGPGPSPGAAPHDQRAPPLARGSAAAAVAEPEQVGIAAVILVSVVTLGVYGAIKFFQVSRAYERLAGRETRFALHFWLWVGLTIGGAFLNLGGVFGWPLSIASLVFMFLALAEALRARREALQRWALQPRIASDNTHYLYLALGVLLLPVLIGFAFLVLQAVKWFEDWNAIRAAALARG
jgi:hypothetical protein